MNIFQRAHLGQNLSPEERAFLKFLQGAAITAGVAAIGTLATVVTNGATFHDALLATLVAFAVTLLLALVKYFSANGQGQLATVLQGIVGTIEQHAPAGSMPVDPSPDPAPAPRHHRQRPSTSRQS